MDWARVLGTVAGMARWIFGLGLAAMVVMVACTLVYICFLFLRYVVAFMQAALGV